MDVQEDDNAFTPLRTKRKTLGVRRSITKKQFVRTPLSDVKQKDVVEYLQNEIQSQCDSPQTPVTGLKSMRLGSRSSNSNSYKLSLSRTLKDEHRKKKLNFFSQEANESTVSSVTSSSPLRSLPQSPSQSTIQLANIESNEYNPCSVKNLELLTEAEIRDEIQKKSKVLEEINKHEQKVNELKALVELWKNGFRDSFADLSQKFGLHDSETILEQLHLSKELIKYCK